MKILMVCLGNICRSPLAEGILRGKSEELGLTWDIDSAGTSGWHTGDPPDPRSVEIAARHGLDISWQRARKLTPKDIDEFDMIFVMDDENHKEVMRYCHSEKDRSKVKKIMDVLPLHSKTIVPDPYFGEYRFDLVFQMLDDACDKIIEIAKSTQ